MGLGVVGQILKHRWRATRAMSPDIFNSPPLCPSLRHAARSWTTRFGQNDRSCRQGMPLACSIEKPGASRRRDRSAGFAMALGRTLKAFQLLSRTVVQDNPHLALGLRLATRLKNVLPSPACHLNSPSLGALFNNMKGGGQLYQGLGSSSFRSI